MSDPRYLICDTETTGPTTNDRAVEIAWVEIDEDLQVLDRQHSLIDPEMAITPGASGVHGLVAADVIDAPTIAEFFQYILGHRLVGDIVFIAHNAQFDLRYWSPYIDNLAATLCTLRLARRFFPEAPDHKLSTLMYFLSLTRGDKHRAAGDVETTLDLLRKIVERSGMTLAQLAEDSAKPMFIETMTFGKHRGWKMRDVPLSWFNWLLRQNGTIDRDLLYTIETIKAGR